MAPLRELAAELEGMGEPDQDDDDDANPPVLPPGFSMFEARPEAVAKLRAAGRDPTVTAVRVLPVYRNRRAPQIAKYQPEGLSVEALREVLPPGTYDLVGVNADGLWVGSRRLHLNDATNLSPQKLPNGNGNGNGNGGSVADRVLEALAMRGLNGTGSDKSSEMEKATAGMVKAMMAMTQMQVVEMKQRMMLMDHDDAKRNNGDNNALNLLKTILPLVQGKKSNEGNGNGSGLGKFEDFFAVMQLGAQWQKGVNGNAPEPQPESELRAWLLPLAETLGPGLVSVAAMMLPPEQRKMASDLLEQHFRTREAEARANADPDTSDDPPTVDTAGETVGAGD